VARRGRVGVIMDARGWVARGPVASCALRFAGRAGADVTAIRRADVLVGVAIFSPGTTALAESRLMPPCSGRACCGRLGAPRRIVSNMLEERSVVVKDTPYCSNTIDRPFRVRATYNFESWTRASPNGFERAGSVCAVHAVTIR